VFFTEEWSPVILDQQTKAGVSKTPNQQVILVHPACNVNSKDRFDSWSAHLRRSMPCHSRTMVYQKPLRKRREEDGSGILSRISASSVARACCTRGLSDIQ